MPVDPSIVGRASPPVVRSWDATDCLLYALSVGAGPSAEDLAFTTENSEGVDQLVLPTFALIAGWRSDPLEDIGTYDPKKRVHGEQTFSVTGAIPTSGSVRVETTVADLYDKGTAAVMLVDTHSYDPDTGRLLFSNRASVFLGGAGGWGGSRGPSAAAFEVPAREPDHVVTEATLATQALWYRLNGDRFRGHSDPVFAARAGFDRPILHGLCTYGFAGRALLRTLCGNDPARFRSMNARFVRPVLPGDTLSTAIWSEGTTAVFRTTTQSGAVVLDRGWCTWT